MDEAAKQQLREAIREASSDILKMLMEAMAEPEGGVGIDQVEALVDGHVSSVIDSLLTEAQAAALAMAADVSKRHDDLLVFAFNTVKDEPPVHKQILALSPLNVTRYIERLRLEARKQGIQYAITHYQKGASYLQCELVELKRQIAANACTCDRDSWPGKANTNLHEIGCPARNAEVKK